MKINAAYVAELIGKLEKDYPNACRQTNQTTRNIEMALTLRGHLTEYVGVSVVSLRKEIIEYGYLLIDSVEVPVEIVAHIHGYEITEEHLRVVTQ